MRALGFKGLHLKGSELRSDTHIWILKGNSPISVENGLETGETECREAA